MYKNVAEARASNHNEVTAELDTEVRKGVVLGSTMDELPDTGPQAKMAIYFLENFLTLLFGVILYKKTKIYDEVAS